MNIVMKCGVLILSMCILTGCVTTNNFKSLPVESSDFELPYETLTEKYTEIPLYEKEFRGFSINAPLSKYLVDAWGEPDIQKADWYHYPLLGGELALIGVLLQAGPVALVAAGSAALLIEPVPSETYIWQKGNYCIEAKTNRIFPDYKKKVSYWKWIDVNTSEQISKGCNQARQQKNSVSEHTSVQQ